MTTRRLLRGALRLVGTILRVGTVIEKAQAPFTPS